MPGRYGYRRKRYGTYRKKKYYGGYRKKKFAKWRKLSPYTNSITKSVQGPAVISDKQFVKMKYSVPFSITEASSSFTNGFFFGNGFDNNSTLPPGIQNWAAFYSKFRIFGSKLKMTFANEGAQNLQVGLLARSDNTVALTQLNVMNQPYCKWKMIAPAGGGNNVKTVKMFMKSKKMFGQKVTQEDDYQGSFTYFGGNFASAVDPNTVWYWEYFVSSDVNAGVSMKVVCEITFYILFEDRRLQPVP